MSVKKMSNSAYQQVRALSHSLLVKAKINPMLAYLQSNFNPEYESPSDNDALIFGQLFHVLVRLPDLTARREEYLTAYRDAMAKYAKLKENKKRGEPMPPMPIINIQYDEGTIYITDFGLSRRNKAYAEAREQVRAKDDDMVITADEFERACDQARCLLAHPVYQRLHADAEIIGDELCIVRQLDGYDYKIKVDRLIKRGDEYIIFDWKSTKEEGVTTMQNVGQRMGYDIQNELYKRMVAEEYGVPMSQVQMIFFLQCKEMPLTMFAFDFGPESESQARIDRQMAADDFMERLNRNVGLAGFVQVQTEIMRFRHYANAFVDFTPIN